MDLQRILAKLNQAPPIELSDPAYWNKARAKAKNFVHIQACVDFAECWARLMQLELAQGKKLEEIWRSTLDEARLLHRLSDPQVGVAVGYLEVCWVHGPKLMRVLRIAGWRIGLADTTMPDLPGHTT